MTQRPRPRLLLAATILTALALLFLSACSPLYVMRAGWEEAGILWRRQDIEELLADSELSPDLRYKFQAVLAARDFAQSVGLEPAQSFTQYSQLDREVLVWVLSASAKTAIKPYTWWFPIVGRVPYKGFFDLDEAKSAAKKLQAAGNDIYLRPSPAFSTLGWFNDPLLSTLTGYELPGLVNVVIHEILHNTAWIPNHTTFNESMANAVGTIGAIHFFEHSGVKNAAYIAETKDIWHDELIYARFLSDFYAELVHFYGEQKDLSHQEEEILARRELLFATARNSWAENSQQLRTERYQQVFDKLNNAVIIAQHIYLDRLWLFDELYNKCNKDLPCLVQQLKNIVAESKKRGLDPYAVLEDYLAQ